MRAYEYQTELVAEARGFKSLHPGGAISSWRMDRCISSMRALITTCTAACQRAMATRQEVLNRLRSKRMNTTRRKRYGIVCLGLGGLLAISGCGGPFDATVSGVVTVDGKTVPRGNIAFHPASGGPAAYALISENGSYAVQTGRESGLPSGDYQVSITANELPTSAHGDKGGPPPPGKAITPVWYSSKETSGLTVTVKPGRNEIPLELKTAPPAGWKPRGK